MMDDNQIHEQQTTEKPHQKSKKNKNWFSNILAGMVGAALTLTFALAVNDFSPTFNQEDHTTQIQSSLVSTETSNLADVQETSSVSTPITKTVEEASQAIVGVVNIQETNPFFSRNGNSQSKESGTGSGVVFKKTGNTAYIVTNNHVIENANEVEISFHNGEKVEAQIVGTDPLTDLAVLKVRADHVTTVMEFGDSSKLRPGEQVLAIGNPLGLDFSRTVTQGIISGTERTINVSTSAGAWDLDVIQTDAAINPGNSGGALINTQGQVIGINSLKISQNGVEGLGFAIPSNDVVPIINELIEDGEVKRPYIGVSLIDVHDIPSYYRNNIDESLETGTMVAKIDTSSPAVNSGLEVEDVIIAIDETEVKDASDLRKYLYTKVDVGDEVTLKINRNGEILEINIKLTD